MGVRVYALLMGIVFGLIGIAGFVPGFTVPIHYDAPPLIVDEGYGLVLGLFPVNVLHNLVHLLFGVLGLVAGIGRTSAVWYARFVAISYGVLTIMGLIPVLNTTFGLIPLYGADIILHAAIAAVSAYFGWMYRAPVRTTTTTI